MPVGAIIAGALGAVKAGIGIAQDIKGNKIAKQNVRPIYDIPSQFGQNVQLGEANAQSGLSESAINALQQESERGLASTLDAQQYYGGNPNSVSSTVNTYIRGLQATAVEDSRLKDQKLKELYGLNKDLGSQKISQFLFNKYEPYKDNAALADQLKTQGLSNAFSGLDQIGASAIGGFGGAGGGTGAAAKNDGTNDWYNAQLQNLFPDRNLSFGSNQYGLFGG